MKKIFLLIGAPGSGKTTTMELIKEPNITHYSIGAMYREISMEDTNLGIEVKRYIDKSQVVPIQIAKKVIEQFINTGSEFLVIDAFPRNMEQALMLEKVIKGNAELIKVIELLVDENLALKRITHRARGIDDDPKLFKERMRVYNEEIEEIRKYYSDQNLYIQLECEVSNEDTAQKLRDIILDRTNGK